jgi:hypothetical protein
MTLQFEYRVFDDYLHIVSSGEFVLDSARQAFAEWMQEANRQSLNKVIWDARLTGGLETGKLSMLTRYDMCSFIAEAKPADIRLAILVSPDQVPEDRFGEHVMVNRGANVKITADLAEALEWLGVEGD